MRSFSDCAPSELHLVYVGGLLFSEEMRSKVYWLTNGGGRALFSQALASKASASAALMPVTKLELEQVFKPRWWPVDDG